MRNFLLLVFVVLFNVLSAQTATYEQVRTKAVKGSIDEYITESGVSFKVGDTLKIGYPSVSDRYTHVFLSSDLTASAIGGAQPTPLSSIYAGNMSVIKKMKSSYRNLTVSTYGKGESKAFTITNFEQAFKTGEVILPNYLTSNEALEKLKKEKDKLDLGLISQDDFDKAKAELSKYIK